MTKMTSKKRGLEKRREDRDDNKVKFVEVLTLSAGNVSVACTKIGVSRETYYRWLREDKSFYMDVDDIKESLLDMAETMLLKGIKDGGTAEIIFYLKTRGKNRGYVERQEITGTDGEPLVMTPEEREARIAALEARAKKGK